MTGTRTCDECGKPIPSALGQDFCPRCLFSLAETVGRTPHGRDGANEALIGRRIGNYEIRERIGQGGMGVVFRARQVDLGRSVALKVIRSGPFASESEMGRFQAEARAAAALRHPNLVTIHEVGEDDGRPFFSMDFIEGESLAEIVQRSSPAPEQSAEYVRAIAEAIDYAHREGVLHRDLKPANVLIDSDGNPHVTDFGLAKLLDDERGMTVSGDAMGSPGYTAPEVALGRISEVGPASDVYSMGAILYDLFTGRPPFLADTPIETFRQATEGDPVPPRVLNPKLPRDLETICLKCLEREPSHRFASASELASELGRFIRGEPVVTRPLSPPTRLWRWAKRSPVPALLTALLVLMTALIGTAAFLFRQDILAGNMQEASLSAKLIDQQLESLGEEVEQIATQRELARLLDDPDGNAPALEALLAGRRRLANEREAKWLGGTAPFHSFSIFDGRGEILFRDPPPSQQDDARDYSDRDHFKGAMRRGDSAGSHVSSLIYDSWTDTDAGTRDKFGISKAIRSRSGRRFVFLASIPTAPTAGLSGFRRNAVLIGRRDPTNELREPYPWLIIAHPALGSDREAIGIEELPISEDAIPGGSGFYFDPAASHYRRFAGPWLAGSAWVEDSEFIVIVQTRDQVTNALLTIAVVALAAGFAVFLWRLRSRRRAVAPA